MVKIGVLAMQGSVEEHISMLEGIPGVMAKAIKRADQLEDIDGIILPGGESTAIGNLISVLDITTSLRRKIEQGLPVWGTCAGMILLAKSIANDTTVHLGLMDIKVRRNAYGRQLESFMGSQPIKEITDEPFPMIFIRAPWIEEIWNDVIVLQTIDNKITAARQKNMLVTSFHPELTDNDKVHKYFIGMVNSRL